MEEIISVPAFNDMDTETQQKHCELRHQVNMSEARHTVQHAAGLAPEHRHNPDAAHRRAARQNDIRGSGIEPRTKEVLFISGQDEWGSTND